MTDAPSPYASTVYFDAELRPNRSLSARAFTIVMIFVGVCSFFGGVAFLTIGAIPVVGFFGLDALAIWLAFRFSFRDQRQRTRVRVTARHLRVDHVDPKGRARHVELETAFVRVELDQPLRPTSWLTLVCRSEAYVIGRFLTMEERSGLAEALRAALRSARAERLPSTA